MPKATDTRNTGCARTPMSDPDVPPPPSRRRLLGGLALGAVTTMAPVAAVLSPDPVWGAPAADAELIALCRAETANCRRFIALSEETAHLRFPQPKPVRDEFATLVDRTWRAREAISAIPAHSLAGVRAKAEALRADWTPGLHGDELAIADSLLDDLLRLLPSEVTA